MKSNLKPNNIKEDFLLIKMKVNNKNFGTL